MRPWNPILSHNPQPLNPTQIEVLEYITANSPTAAQLSAHFKFNALSVYKGLQARGYIYTDHQDNHKLKTRMGDDV